MPLLGAGVFDDGPGGGGGKAASLEGRRIFQPVSYTSSSCQVRSQYPMTPARWLSSSTIANICPAPGSPR